MSELTDFEENVRDAVFLAHSVLEVRLRMPVAQELKGLLKKALSELRDGKPLPPKSSEGGAIKDLVESYVSLYEDGIAKHYEKVARRRGVSVPTQGLAEIERSALKSFVLWALLEHVRSSRNREDVLAAAFSVVDGVYAQDTNDPT